MAQKPGNKPGNDAIAVNRRARHEYHVDEEFEAGLALEGWEVKSLRAGKANLSEAHVIIKNGEALLLGSHINPLNTVSTHHATDPTRTRKLLLHRSQIDHLQGAVDRAGYTLVPLRLYFTRGKAKLRLALARGKKLHDKRATEKSRDWSRERQRLLKTVNR